MNFRVWMEWKWSVWSIRMPVPSRGGRSRSSNWVAGSPKPIRTFVRHWMMIPLMSSAPPRTTGTPLPPSGHAGRKDIVCGKPCSHNIYEGRQSVNAARKYNRIVQHGTQSRSDRNWWRIKNWSKTENTENCWSPWIWSTNGVKASAMNPSRNHLRKSHMISGWDRLPNSPSAPTCITTGTGSGILVTEISAIRGASDGYRPLDAAG